MKFPDFYLRSIDLQLLFLYGFGLFIASFNPNIAFGYILFIMFGAIYLGYLNPILDKRREVKK